MTEAKPELAPLLRHLEEGLPVARATVFPRGTHLPDGRLDLCKQDLGPEGAALVARALRHNRVVTSLLLGADDLGDDGATAIAHLAADNETVSTLFLACNIVGERGARAVAHAVGARGSTRALWMKRNPIGAGGVLALASVLGHARILRTLDVAQTGLKRETAAARALALAIAEHPSLERLYLSGNDLGADDVEWIAPLLRAPSPVRALYLSANRLGDEGACLLASALADNRTLTSLSMGSNGLTARGVRAMTSALHGHPTLMTFELARPPSTRVLGVAPDLLDDDALGALVRLLREAPALRRVTVDGTHASTVARGELEEALMAARRTRGHVEGPSAVPEDVRAIRSVYRTSKSPAGPRRGLNDDGREASMSAREEAPPPSAADVAKCVSVLEALRARPDLLLAKESPYASVRTEANRVIAAVRAEVSVARRARSKDESKRAVARRDAHDHAAAQATGIRVARDASRSRELVAAPLTRLKARPCYVCKEPYTLLDRYYDALCPRCAKESHEKRERGADLRGRVALVTGGRVKIGHRVALRLLRAGARVIITTRFPHDAARRYAGEADFDAFAPRLSIHGLDFRSLRMVDAFAERIAREEPFLDVLIHNAAQTVRRPAPYYAHLIEGELSGGSAPRVLGSAGSVVVHATSSALLSQTPLLEDDARHDPDAFPPGALTRDGQQVDKRPKNSWEMSLGEIDVVELLETHHVNAFAPFVLTSKLLPSLEASPHEARFVVNVSAMEGKFDYANKMPTHPHTNMAKAALNMLTRTSGPALAKRRIYMTSVDTGWITNEHAEPIAESMERRGFGTPLDEEDGAARVLDPVLRAIAGDAPLHSVFLKDYRQATW